MSDHRLKIGEVAIKARVNPKTIRYYEEIGLLPKAVRNESGYRLYSQEDLDRLQFIRRAKLLGLTLVETKHVFQHAVREQCRDLQHDLLRLVQGKLAEIDERMADLTALKNELSTVRMKLLQSLEQDAPPNPPATRACECLTEQVEDVSRMH